MSDRAEDRDKLLQAFRRDLCVYTELEMRDLWTGPQYRAIDEIMEGLGGIEVAFRNHNPLYYILTRAFFDNHPDWLWAPLHRDRICAEIVSYIISGAPIPRGVIIAVQRESFKTTTTHGALPLWYAFRRKVMDGHDARVGVGHHKEKMARKSVRRLRRKLMGHEWLRETWPEFCPPADAKEFGSDQHFDFPCKTSGSSESEYSIQALGLQSTETGGHFDLICLSDGTTKDHRKSKLIRDEAVESFQDLSTMRDTLTGKLVYDCTFWHPNDLTQRLKRSQVGKDLGKVLGVSPDTPAYRSVVIGAGGTRAGAPLTMPNRHTEEFLEMRRTEIVNETGNDHFWWLQYQNDVRAESMVVTDEAWLRRVPMREVPMDMWRCIFIDPAWKGTHNAGKGDYAALTVVGFHQNGYLTQRYLLHVTRSNEMSAMDGCAEVFRLMDRYGTTNVAPEEHGGYVFRGLLQAEAQKRGRYINILDLKSKQTHKEDRITTFLNSVQGGNFFIVDPCPGDEHFVAEFRDFGDLDHEDVLDSVAYSCDPNIVELNMPAFNEEADDWGEREAYDSLTTSTGRRTRHCGL